MKCESCNLREAEFILPIGDLKVCRECYDKTKVNPNLNSQEVKNKMATLKEEALAYEPPLTLNIADLDEVPVDLQVHKTTKKNSKGEEYSYKYAEFNDKEYRIPNSVLEEIQKILKLKPEVMKVNVTKSGDGLGTRYKVDAL